MNKRAGENARPADASRTGMLNIFSEAGQANSNNKNYQFWKQDSHPFIVTTEKFFMQKLNYLHENPVRAGFVHQADQWQYSSAMDYCGKQIGMIEIEMI